MPYTTSGKIPRKPPRRTGDWLSPPPVPEGPTRDSSRKEFEFHTKVNEDITSILESVVEFSGDVASQVSDLLPEPRKMKRTPRGQRKPSCTPFTVSSPRPKPSKTPYTRGGGGFDIWQPIKRCYDWMDYFGFRTNWELILGLSTSVHPVYQLLYEFNAWLYMYNLVVLIVLISTMIYRWRYEHKPKRKTNGEQMDSISDLFEGYEDEEQPPEFHSQFHSQFHPTEDIIRR